MKPGVDVLLACYNGERFLQQQTESIRRQLFREFRVLCRDDGSTDGTVEMLEKLCRTDQHFTIIRDEQHLGAGGNFVSLLRASEGAYCALCDQDDVWAPDHLAALMDAMKKAEASCEPGLPLLVFSDCAVVDEAGKVLSPSLCMHQGWKREALPLKQLLMQNNVTGCTILMNAPLRRLVAEHAPENLTFHDWFIALTAAAFGGISFVAMPLVDYRQHGDNTIGASKDGMLKRGLQSLKQGDKARERIRFSYTYAKMFRDAYGETMPPESLRQVEEFLATEQMPRLRRVMTLRRKGYVMQNPLFRLGQLIYG